MTEFYKQFAIGNTPQEASADLSEAYGARVSVKHESYNSASGTVKDRRNEELLKQCKDIEWPIYFVGITSGSDGYSRGHLCNAFEKASGIKRRSISIIGKDVPKYVERGLSKAYNKVIRLDLSKEAVPNPKLIQIAKDCLRDQKADVRLVEQVSRSNGYSSIIKEILERTPDVGYMFCPVGEGELMSHLADALYDSGSPAKLVGVTVPYNVFAQGKEFITAKNGTANGLHGQYSDYRKLLTRQCSEYGYEIMTVEDDDILTELPDLEKLGISAGPEAAAAFAGARMYANSRGFTKDDNVVIINTGKSPFYEIGDKKRLSRDTKMLIGTTVGGVLLIGSILLWRVGIPAYEHAALVRKTEKECRQAVAEYESRHGKEIAEKLKTSTSWREYVAFAHFKSLQAEPEKQKEVFDKVLDVFEMRNYGGIDAMVVTGSPELMRIINEFDIWKNNK